jgi:hypothetical protein
MRAIRRSALRNGHHDGAVGDVDLADKRQVAEGNGARHGIEAVARESRQLDQIGDRRGGLHLTDDAEDDLVVVGVFLAGIHERTVRRVVENRLPNVTGVPLRPIAPLVLGIHQVEIQGRRRAVLVDVGDLRVLDVLPGVSLRGLAKWIDKLGEPRQVQVVSIDLDFNHRDLVRMFWGIRPLIVVDRRHFDALAKQAWDAVGGKESSAVRDATRRASDGFLTVGLTEGELEAWLAGVPSGARRALAPLRRALRAWQHDLLAQQRDLRAAGAPWRTLHDWLEIIDQRHRDDEFDAARAAVLACPTIPGPPGFDRCEQCGRRGVEHRVHARFPVPLDEVSRTPEARLQRTCFDCRPQIEVGR